MLCVCVCEILISWLFTRNYLNHILNRIDIKFSLWELLFVFIPLVYVGAALHGDLWFKYMYFHVTNACQTKVEYSMSFLFHDSRRKNTVQMKSATHITHKIMKIVKKKKKKTTRWRTWFCIANAIANASNTRPTISSIIFCSFSFRKQHKNDELMIMTVC